MSPPRNNCNSLLGRGCDLKAVFGCKPPEKPSSAAGEEMQMVRRERRESVSSPRHAVGITFSTCQPGVCVSVFVCVKARIKWLPSFSLSLFFIFLQGHVRVCEQRSDAFDPTA